LSPAEQFKKFNCARVPAGHVPRELFQHRRRAFAPAEADRVRDLRALAANLRHDVVQRAIADQIAEVRHDPIRAGFDELVVVKLRQIFFEHARLIGDDGQQRLERLASLGVPGAINRRQQFVNAFAIEAHAITPSSSSGAGSSVSNSLATMLPSASISGSAASSRVSKVAVASERYNLLRSTATTPGTDWTAAITSLENTG